MAQASPLVADFAVVLGVATVTGALARRLNQPPVLGYLLAGLIVGPYIPIPLFADVERVREMSELGVVLVMFTVGLEFSLSRAAQVLPTAGLAAAVQISGLFWAGNLVGVALGLSTAGQVVLGAGMSVSSTMVVTKVFEVHKPPKDVRGLVLGVLVLQDIVAIVLIAVVTAVAAGASASPGELLGVAGQLLGAIVVAGLLGLVVIPRLTRAVARLDMPEVDTVFAVGVCFAFGGLMQLLGYSPALGAFLAGALVAESGLAERYEHLVAPIRDVFAAIFFVSIGMQVDPLIAVGQVPQMFAVAGLVLLAQLLLVGGAGVLSGQGVRKSLHSGLALGQLGEFAFIIVGIGVSAGLLPASLFTIIVGAAVLTTFTTSVGLANAAKILDAVEHALPGRVSTLLSMYAAWVARATGGGAGRAATRRPIVMLAVDAAAIAGIVIGASFVWPVAVGWLEGQGIPSGAALSVAVAAVLVGIAPFARAIWRAARALGTNLAAAALPEGEDGPDLSLTSRVTLIRALQLAALLGTGMLIVAVTRPFVPPGWGMLTLGVALVPAAAALWRSGAPLESHVQSATLALFELLRRQDPVVPTNVQTESLLRGLGDVTRVVLPPGAPAVGSTLAGLDLRAQTGASVLAIADAGGQVVAPASLQPLEAGSVLALTGPPESISRARELLLGLSEPDDA
ncbi:MAG: cation:proton antiporter [Nannocystaceae bacterium]|nr:cation:proton antiporter [bacterium]